jgi:hypothetical protein
MQQHRADTTIGAGQQDQPADVRGGITRREALAGGSLAVGALLLTGCGASRTNTALPTTYWNSEGPQTVSAPPASPAHPYVPSYSRPSVVTGPPIDPLPVRGIIPRSQWARTGVARPSEIYEMNGVRRITVHHDGMPPASLSSMRQVASRIEQIRQSHVVGRGWADLGYHYVIDPSGRIWEGRPIRYQGAHVKDQNENNLGILVMGNFDLQSPTSAALGSLDSFLGQQMQQYRLSLGTVRTHMERAPTACPGRNLQAYMIRTRSGGGQLNSIAGRYGLNRG